MGKIIGRLLEDKGIPFLYNFGIMGTRERDKNLQDFKENSEIKVLVSVKAACLIAIVNETNPVIPGHGLQMRRHRSRSASRE